VTAAGGITTWTEIDEARRRQRGCRRRMAIYTGQLPLEAVTVAIGEE
jgi:hypothetical protein